MKHKGLILMAALSISVAFGCTLGHNMGTSFAKEWSAQSYSITADVKYQSLIDEIFFSLKKTQQCRHMRIWPVLSRMQL